MELPIIYRLQSCEVARRILGDPKLANRNWRTPTQTLPRAAVLCQFKLDSPLGR